MNRHLLYKEPGWPCNKEWLQIREVEKAILDGSGWPSTYIGERIWKSDGWLDYMMTFNVPFNPEIL